MVKLLKFIIITGLIILFFYIFGFVIYDSLLLQVAGLLVVLAINAIKESIAATWQLLKILLPFTVTLFLFGLLFQVIHLQGRDDWLYDSLIKVVFFPASFTFTKLAISFFTYRDILGLPLKMQVKREIIFMQTFFRKAYQVIPRMEFYAGLHPGIQTRRGLRRSFVVFCSFPLSLYLYLMEEGQILRDYYQNRINILEDK